MKAHAYKDIRHHSRGDLAQHETLACSRPVRTHARVLCCICDEMLWSPRACAAQVVQKVHRKDWQEELLAAGILGVLKGWLEPIRGSLPLLEV